MSTWTDDLPTSPGWYWFRDQKRSAKCVLIDVNSMGVLFRDGRLPMDAKSWKGQWCGPIPEPKEP